MLKWFMWMLVSISLSSGALTKGTKQPHICFILVDDLGWNDVSFHGSYQIPTPNIDVLAANGIVLNNYYTQPFCTPSRAALMTGRHPIEYGLQSRPLKAMQAAGLYLNITLLPEHLKKLGYKTYGIGKWHLGFFHKEYTPHERGFDSFLGYWPGAMDYYTHESFEVYSDLEPYGWGKALRRNMTYADDFRGKYATHLFTEEAKTIIKNHDISKPLFLYLSHLAVHTGNSYDLFQAPQFYVDQVHYIKDIERRTFAAMVLALDESVGEMFKALEKKGILDNTIFIVSTDNGGEAAGYRGGVGSNWPLRGNKGTVWEGGVRGTALIWSRLLHQNRRISNQLMHISDWLPTLYRAAGGDPEVLGDIYGQDLWNALSNDTPSPRIEILHNIDPVQNEKSIRTAEYKLIIGSGLNGEYDQWYGPTGRDNGISVTEYLWRLRNAAVTRVLKRKRLHRDVTDTWLSQMNVKCYPLLETCPCMPKEEPCLFNVIEDPCERNNIADKYPQIVEEMKSSLEDYSAMAVPLVNQTLDPRADPCFYDHHWTNWADYPPNYYEHSRNFI